MMTYRSALIVDSDPFVRITAELYLLSSSVRRVYKAAEGKQALEFIQCKGEVIDLVITGLNMCGMDGLQILRGLRDAGFAGHLVIASGQNGSILQAASAIASESKLHLRGVISKPLSKDKLDAVLLVDPPQTAATKQPDEIDAVVLHRLIENFGIIPYFQPKVDVRSLKIVGVEALMRAKDSEAGFLGAHQIIPVAREHDLMRELTREMIAKSLTQLKLWDREGIDINLAINIDPKELHELNLPDKLSDIVEDLRLAASRITIEVTEESFASGFLDIMEVVTRLRMKGFCTACDDFGTGRSNLDTLEILPFTELKIDQSFVSKALADAFADAGARAAVRLAQSLNLKTVAEGVETASQFDYVAGLGVDVIQGYVFAKPMPAEEFAGWYRSNNGFVPAPHMKTHLDLAV